MTEDRTLFQNLLHRRVPQIAGMYIGAMWLVIELGDWVTERFALPGHLTSYVFVAMLVMLPAVLLVAYNHGAPGRDRWTRAERIFVPVNAAVAAALLWFTVPLIDAEAATETLTIEDETGAIQEFEIARQGHHRELITFFWENQTGDAELDWLSYGLPIMLAHDINRVSPVLTADTPIDSVLLRDRLPEQGHDRLLDVPRGLAVELTRERQSDALVLGSFREDGNQKIVSASVVDAQTGNELESISRVADDWMSAVDAVTAAILGIWEISPAEGHSDDPVSDHFSSSLEAVRHFTLGRIAIEIDGDYPVAVAEFDAAISIDPGFAEANGELSVRQYLSGNLEAARASAAEALRNSYRLSTGSEFSLKANRYFYDGDYARGERVLEIWTEVEPNSTQALQAMAQILRVRGTQESLEGALSAYDRLLELRPNDYSIYRERAGIEQQRGNKKAAIDLLSTYLEHVPDSGAAHNQLASLYQSQGDLDAAERAFEDASILLDDPLPAKLGLVRLAAGRGAFDAALARLDALHSDELRPQQELQILMAEAEVAIARGRVEQAMRLLTEANELGENLLPPANRILGIEALRAELLADLGRFDEAIAATDAIVEKLQPPLSSYLNTTYTSIYSAADNREAFRRWAQTLLEERDQLPDFYDSMIALEQAQLAIWDDDPDAAIELIDDARAKLDQSIIQLLLGNLVVTEVFLDIADLYLDAGATDEAKNQLEEVLHVSPGNALAKSLLGRVLIAEGDQASGRRLLEEALVLWSDADDELIYAQEARDALAALGTG
ncbi:MAG: tetratricopeptide repeat protein [Woeseiaceae bacterium]